MKASLERALVKDMERGNMATRTAGPPQVATETKQEPQQVVQEQPEPPQTTSIVQHSPSRIFDLGGIRGLVQPKLQELGKIKIGKKSDQARSTRSGGVFYAPEKLDHFVVVKNEQDERGHFIVDQAVMAAVGERPMSLDIALLSNIIGENFVTYLGLYVGRKRICYGNGEVAWAMKQYRDADGSTKIDESAPVVQRNCPCEKFEQGKCKAHGVLTVILRKAPTLGGVYRFRTTGLNSISQIMGALQFIHAMTGGMLAGLPLTMTMTKQTGEATVNGSRQSLTYYTVNIVYQGDAEGLLDAAVKAAERRLKFSTDVRQLEEQTKYMLRAAGQSDSDADVQEEFAPENAELPA